MGQHEHGDPAWPVRIDDAGGDPRGSGVLLDDRHVLTCAHVVHDAGAGPGGTGQVRVRSLACRPEWSRGAHVDPRSWVYEGTPLQHDVALLRLDEPADCGIGTVLLRAPLSRGVVRAYGFESADFMTMPVDAELGGRGGRNHDWELLKPLATNTPWIREGYSGAGVVMREGEFKGRVIGIVLADYSATDTKAAWLLPAEVVEQYLGEWIADFVQGAPANRMADHRVVARRDTLHDTLRLALTRELTRLLDPAWSGTVVVRTGGTTNVGTSWLVRLVGTADPASRAAIPGDAFTGAPRGTVLGLGAIDAAYDARGRSLADVRDYLVGRFGLGEGDAWEVRRRLLRRSPPASVVVDGVDRSAEPYALVRDLLGPLAAAARLRGMRLVLGFEGPPPDELAHDVLLDPEPVTGDVQGPMGAAEPTEAVQRLADDEAEVMRLQFKWGAVFRHPPRALPSAAPRLRVRLAVARDTAPNLELAAVHARAGAAAVAARRYRSAVRRQVEEREDLLATLELYRGRGARHLGDEDLGLAEPYLRASEALHTTPISLTRARRLVTHYMDQVNERIDGSCGEDGENGEDGEG